MENVGIFYGHMAYFMVIWHILWSYGIFSGLMKYFMDIWHILWTFGIFSGPLVFFSSFGILYQEKSGNPGRWSVSRDKFCTTEGSFIPGANPMVASYLQRLRCKKIQHNKYVEQQNISIL
jgi:hypothetical protein